MLSPEFKLKQEIINLTLVWEDKPKVNLQSNEEVEALYEKMYDEDILWDAISEIRCSGINTNIACPYSRHYESQSVALQCIDGSWVGWTYWYGGGKHGEPESIDWIEHAYDLDVKEEEKLVIVREFSKKEEV
ncbi:hypothetical protein [Pseudomonas phage vB_PsaM_M1]|nr:hypothetical protein [Pseudomonas phage vB_PsaM_M1]